MTTSGAAGRSTATTGTSAGRPGVMLGLATVGFLVNFWAWALISPLGVAYREQLGLTAFQQALLVAVPVIVGSVGRIPVGALTDRLGARVMFPAVSFLTILPVLFVGLLGDSYPLLLVGGFFLGLGGTAFAVGVPLVNAWYPPARRGLALGIFGMGMGGTAVSAFTTVQLATRYGRAFPFVLVAVVLAVYGWWPRCCCATLRGARFRAARSSPAPGPPCGCGRRCSCSALYAVGFGGFVAFSVYLPTYLKNAYGLTQSDAALRTAGFVVLAVLMRPVGGWLSDRFHPVPVLTVCFAAAAALAVLAAARLNLLPAGTVAFLGLAAMLGAASGACFALVARVAPAEKVGGVTGIVGAAGGLGGFVPPLVMGALYGATGSYTIGLLLLALVALAAAVYTWLILRREART